MITLYLPLQESLHQCLNDLFNRVVFSDPNSVNGSLAGSLKESSLDGDVVDSPIKLEKTIYEEYFPELFMY